MSAKQRDLIKDYLYAGFNASGNFSRIEVGRTPLDPYKSPESARFLSLWRDDGQRYLVTVHADEGYKPNQNQFSALMRDMSSHRIACVSVFDDSVFFHLDANEDGRPKANREGGRKGRIKLLGLERLVQAFGDVTYYKHKSPRIQVISYSPATADHSLSERVPEWKKGDTQLLTVMEPHVLATYQDSFDLLDGREIQGMYLTGFTQVIPKLTKFELDQLEEEEGEEVLDRRAQFVRDELEGGRDPDDIPESVR